MSSLTIHKPARDLKKGDRVLGEYGAHTVLRIRPGFVKFKGFQEGTERVSSVMVDWVGGEWTSFPADEQVTVASK